MRAFLTTTLAAAASISGVSAAASSSNPDGASYDYIVVGGGPAGIIAATRLAQSSSKSVRLISRGQGPTVGTGSVSKLSWNDTLTSVDVPGLSTAIMDYFVGNESVWEAYVCKDTVDVYATCVFGGGASINYMVFPHPPERDFDDKWPVGWKWDDISDAAERVYELNPGSMLPSKDGKRYDQAMYETVSKFLDAQGWSYVDQNAEPNEKTKVYSYPNWDIGDARRVGPVRTYLPLVEDLANFSYQLNSTVRRVLRNGSSVTGVEVQTDSGIETVRLNDGGKVILAAGPWGTPRILFNSGIGPADQIKTVASGTTGIALPAEEDWIELPVGRAVKDHPIFTLYVQTPANWTSYDLTRIVDGTDTTDIDLYEREGSGVLSQGYHRMVFWTSNVASDNVTRYYQGSVSPQGEGLFLIKGYLTHGATSSGAMGIYADGTVGFTQQPYLQTDEDKEGATMFIQEMIDSVTSYGWELANGYTNLSYILDNYSGGNHYLGAANVGTDKTNSVVSSEDVKVWGTDNLYIVDSSIHADLPTGNTQSVTMVVAEHAIEKIIKSEQPDFFGY